MSAWKTIRLGDCCEIVSGATPKSGVESYWGGDVCWVTPKDLSGISGVFISDTPRKITQAGLESCAASVLPAGSVLFSSRAPIGHVAINSVPMATNQGFKSLVPRSDLVDSKYLYYWLRKSRSYLEGLGNGATFKEVSKAIVSAVEIPLPPLGEQRRIAEVLDRVDELRAKRRQTLDQLDGLVQSIFLDMFGDPLANSRAWDDSMSLGDVAEISSGVTKGRKLGAAAVRSVPYLAVLNVQDKRLNLSSVKSIEATEVEIARYRLMRDDLLLTEGGDPDKLGRGSLWREELSEAIHQNHVFRVRISKSSRVNPTYLNWLVSSERGKQYFLRSAKQTTGIASINMTQLKRFPLLLPPLADQQEFARRVEAIDGLKEAQHAHLAELDGLFGSLQDRAFRGAL